MKTPSTGPKGDGSYLASSLTLTIPPILSILKQYTVIARCTVENREIAQVSYIPCLVNKHAQSEVLKQDARGQKVFDYMGYLFKSPHKQIEEKSRKQSIIL